MPSGVNDLKLHYKCNHKVTFTVMDYTTQASLNSKLSEFHTVQNNTETTAAWNRTEKHPNSESTLRLVKC